jgi:predicted  nucleic acid-binding Zn-ribbon protein
LSPIRQLYDLQEIDLDLEMKAEMLRDLEEELANNEAKEKAHAELDRKQQELANLEGVQKTAEWEIDDLEAKVNPLERKLYGGSVKNPKELLDLQQKVENLKVQIKDKEDRALEIMDQVEKMRQETTITLTEVERLESEWQRKQKHLLAKQADLTAVVNITMQRRNELAATIEPAALELYEALRAKKQGRAVAKIEQGRCQGCRIALPLSEVQRARVGELVQCSSCGRILFLG